MSRPGLERHRWIDAIDDFVRQYGRATPRWALFLTYDIDLNRFAKAVLPLLARRGRHFRSVVLADQARLEESLALSQSVLPGAVNLHPVRCLRGGVFHPKLVFLRAGRHIRACFGSANITDGGMGSNLELWTYSESPEILGGLQHFLMELTRSRDIGLDGGACRSIRRALSGLNESTTPSVWSSLEESFASRLRRGPERRAARATIVSPMYAGGEGIKAARAAIPGKKVCLHTDIAVRLRDTAVLAYAPPHIADQADDDVEAFPGTLHAKAYLFRPRDRASDALAWLGSANFTALALTRSVARGGNVELMVRVRLPKDEAEAFEADLETLFPAGSVPANAVPREAAPHALPKATVLACELTEGRTGPRLVVHAVQRNGYVVLMCGGREARVTIKGGRGVLEGGDLRELLPDLDLTAAHAMKLFQVVKGGKVAIVANVPHVPPDDGPGVHAQTSLDALFDDLVGRVRITAATDILEGETDGAEPQDDPEEDPETDELERRLDEVRHQGELDQHAVKAALLRKLIIRTTASGAEREQLLSEVTRLFVATVPQHLALIVRRLFDQVDAT